MLNYTIKFTVCGCFVVPLRLNVKCPQNHKASVFHGMSFCLHSKIKADIPTSHSCAFLKNMWKRVSLHKVSLHNTWEYLYIKK